MDIHEYQAKDILRGYGAAVPRGAVARSAAEAIEVAAVLAAPAFVIKAQVHAGGRGKAGGISRVSDLAGVEREARRLLGATLVTGQTGPGGRRVDRLYIEEAVAIAREFYLALLVDRDTSRIAILVSRRGGVDIETVARETPDAIVTVTVDPVTSICPRHVRRIAAALELNAAQQRQMSRLITSLQAAFVEKDMSLLEINPLVATPEGTLVCLDATLSFDDNALYRHADIAALRDPAQEDAGEAEAARHGLHYVPLDGDIGCMVNGAGLAMATLDMIKAYGSEPACFLDVGGGATREKVMAAFRIITADARVRGILVNIFGGIMKCDVIAEGVVAAAREIGLDLPLVVRLEGTNVELGRLIILESGLDAIMAEDLDDAANQIVGALRR